MKKIITVTPEEKARLVKKEQKKFSCPNCGSIMTTGLEQIEHKGFFFTKSRTTHFMSCFDCKCDFEIIEDWE